MRYVKILGKDNNDIVIEKYNDGTIILSTGSGNIPCATEFSRDKVREIRDYLNKILEDDYG